MVLNFNGRVYYRAHAGADGLMPKELAAALSELSDGSIHLTTDTEHVFIAADRSVYLLANAYYDGTNFQRYDTGAAAYALSLQEGGTVQFRSAAAAANPITWTTYTILDEPATDANGWAVTYLSTGKRQWARRWLGVATAAAVDMFIVSGASLPVGVASHAAVHILATHRMSANGSRVNIAVDGGEATATLSVAASTVDGANLSAKAATIDLFVTLTER